MGRKKQARQIKCPRCGRIGSLRLKDRTGLSVIVYHYDHEKYKSKGGSGSSSCYLGSLNKSAGEILLDAFIKTRKIQIGSDLEEAWFTSTYNKLKNELVNPSKKTKLLPDEDLTKFANLVNEIRKIRIDQEKAHTVIKKIHSWRIECPKCSHEIFVNATLDNIKERQHMSLCYQDLDYL